TVIHVMNLLSILSAVGLVIPFYFDSPPIVWGANAVAAALVLGVVPVWWNVALYGHPIMPALLLFFIPLALIACRPSQDTPLLLRISILLLLALALTFRFDLVLLFLRWLPCSPIDS